MPDPLSAFKRGPQQMRRYWRKFFAVAPLIVFTEAVVVATLGAFFGYQVGKIALLLLWLPGVLIGRKLVMGRYL